MIQQPIPKRLLQVATAALLSALVACGGGGGGRDEDADPSHAIGGSVSGLSAGGLVLHNNAGDALAVPAGATSFRFAARVARGGAYQVTVATQPGSGPQDSQHCTVVNGSGTASADVDSIAVVCESVTPLVLQGSDPGDGAVEVPRNVQPRLDFSLPLASSPEAAVWLRLEGDTHLEPATALYAGSNVTLQPRSRLVPNARYEWAADAALLRGAQGERLGASVVRRFTTTDSTWKDVKSAGVARLFDVDAPSVALDRHGDAIAAWVSALDSDGITVSYYRASTGTWQSGAQPSALPQVGVLLDPRLAMDAEGNALLVWAQDDRANPSRWIRRVWASRYNKTADRWEVPQILSPRDGTEAFSHTVAASGDGRVAVAWVGVEPAGPDEAVFIRHSSLRAGAAWSLRERMDTPADQVETVRGFALAVAPAAAAGDRPQIVVVWGKGYGGPSTPTMVSARFVAAEGRLLPVQTLSAVGSTAANEYSPRVAIDGNGNVHVAWRRSETEAGIHYEQVLGNSWSVQEGAWQPANASLSGRLIGVGAIGEELSISGDGRLVVWDYRRGYIDGGGDLHVWHRDEALVRPLNLTPEQAMQASWRGPGVALATDRAGNAAVVWTTVAPRRLLSARFAKRDGAWLPHRHRLDDSATGTGLLLVGAVNEGGDMLVAWPDPTGPAAAEIRTRLFD